MRSGNEPMVNEDKSNDPGATRTALDSERSLRSGNVLAGRYRIEGLVGVGGMGMVYRAHDAQLDMTVAIKVLRPDLALEQSMLERFRRELVLARQVSHRNVVRIHDIAAENNVVFLTMDFIDGLSLADLLEKEGPLPVTRAVAIAEQLASALASAHREGIVHRDLKPANILIDESDRAYITDFGIARSVTASGLTEAGQVLGTPDYLAPEQARGEEIDGRADIYAFGLILYRMLTNELPFPGGSYEEVIAQHTVGKPRDISRTGVVVPNWLRRITRRCLEREPRDRYKTADALAGDLGASRGTWHLKRRTRTAAMAIAIAGVALLALWLVRPVPELLPSADTLVSTVEPARHVVAVLPLHYEGRSSEWTVRGVSELLAAQLSASRDLQVVDTGRLQQTLSDLDIRPDALLEKDLRRLAELLHVDRLVTGTVMGEAPAFRIQLRVLMSDQPGKPLHTLNENVAAEEHWFDTVDRLGYSLREALDVSPMTEGGRLTDSVTALEHYTQGVAALRAGDSLAAAPLFKRAVEDDPEFAAAWVRLSEAYAALGRDQPAFDAANQAVSQLTPDSGRIAFEARAQHALLSGDPERAEAWLRELLAAFPHDVETHALLAETIGDTGRYEEAIAELSKIVRQDQNHPRAWFLLGKFAILGGDSQRAVNDYLVKALVIQNTLGNDQGRADVFNALGIAYQQLGDIEAAREHYGRAVELRERIGDERGVATALSNVARIDMFEGHYDRARTSLGRALEKLDALGDRQGVANLHNDIGVLEEEIGDYAAALTRYRSALQFRERMGDLRAMAESYNNVGYTYYLLGEYDNASVYARQALNAYQAAANREGIMLARQTTGLLETARGNWTEATRAFLAALETAREIDYPHAAAMSHGNLGLLAHLQGRFQSAAESYERAITIMEEVGDARGFAEFSLHRATLDSDLGLIDAARARLEKISTTLAAADNHEQAARLTALQARNLLLAGEGARAVRDFEQAMERSRRSGNVASELGVKAGFLEALLRTNKADRALQEIDGVRDRVQALGNLPLILRFQLVEADASIAVGDLLRARRVTEEALRLVRGVDSYAWTWRLHRLADTAAESDALAAEFRKRANDEMHRLFSGMNEAQRNAFELMYPQELLSGGLSE